MKKELTFYSHSLYVNPYPVHIFVLKLSAAYYICCIYLNALEPTFIMEANTMTPVQHSDLGP